MPRWLRAFGRGLKKAAPALGDVAAATIPGSGIGSRLARMGVQRASRARSKEDLLSIPQSILSELLPLEQDVVAAEGWRQQAYQDHKGIWTIGVGHNLEAEGLCEAAVEAQLAADPRARVSGNRWQDMPAAEREYLRDPRGGLCEAAVLAQERYDVGRAIEQAVGIAGGAAGMQMSEGQRNALIEMVFQLGGAGVRKFGNMVRAIRRLDWPAAHREALDSKWARTDTPGRAKRVSAGYLDA